MLRRSKVASGLFISLLAGVLALSVPQAPVGAVTGGWEALGTGIPDGTAFQLTMDAAGNIFAGGTFTSAGGVAETKNVAKWNGSNWSSVGGGVTTQGPNGNDGGIYAVALDQGGDAGSTSDDTLYVGGEIAGLGGVSINRVAKWNGSVWSELGDEGGTKNGVNDTDAQWDGVEEIVVASPSSVFIGGSFDNAYAKAGGTVPNTAGIAQYDAITDTMVAVGTGIGDTVSIGDAQIVNGMTLAGTDIIATGQFTSVNGTSTGALRVGRWNGASWSPIGDSTDGAPSYLVAAVAADGNDIYIGGNFLLVKNGGVFVPYTRSLAKWDSAASDWVSIGEAGGIVEELRVIDHGGTKYLYAGGQFTSIGGVTAFNIARLNITVPGSNWEPIRSGCTNGVNNTVRSIIDAGSGAIYVAGKFTDAGNVAAADRVAKFTPGASTACTPRLPPPTDFRVDGILNTYKFYKADGQAAFHPAEGLILKWNPPAGDAGLLYSLYQVTTGYEDFSCRSTGDWCVIYFPYPTLSGLPDATEVTFTLTAVSLFGDSTEVTLGPIGAPPKPEFADGPLPKVTLETEGLLRLAKLKVGIPDLTNRAILTKTVLTVARGLSSFKLEKGRFDSQVKVNEFWWFSTHGDDLFEVQFCYWRQSCYTGATGTVKPYDLTLTSSSRKRILFGLGGTKVTVRGTAPGLAGGSVIYPWIKVGNEQWKQVPNTSVTVQPNGSFSWSSTFPRSFNRTTFQVRFDGGKEKFLEVVRWMGLTSNTLTIGGV